MKIFISKYALSRGVLEVDAEVNDKGFAVVSEPKKWAGFYHGEGREWCRTKEQAVEVAEKKRLKTIASLKQQIGKLKVMTFSFGEGANV